MNTNRLSLALLSALLLSACLTPTESTGRYGEARVQPEFAAGDSPAERGVDVDSIRTIMMRGTERVVNALMAYESDAAHAWILEMQNAEDSVEVTMELMVGGNVAYRGSRKINVVEGTPGRAPVEDVPVALLDTDFAAAINIVPDHVVFTALGATRQLTAEVYDPDDELINKDVDWSSQNNNVVIVNQQGSITATGLGITNVLASVDGISGAATIVVDTMLPHRTTITADSASIAADGKSSTRITVRVLDATGQPIGFSAGIVTLTSSLGNAGPVTDHGDGTYTATLVAGTTPGDAVITGTLNTQAIDDDAIVQFRPAGGIRRTTIDADSSAINADGKSRTLVTVRVVDANGNSASTSSDVVKLQTTLGTLSGVLRQADGSYTALLIAANVAGLAVITGTLNDQPIADSAFVVMRNGGGGGGPGALKTSIVADSLAIDADGQASTLVTVIVVDANGQPLSQSAGPVTLTSSLGTLGPVTDHLNGRYTARLTSGLQPGRAEVTGTLNNQLIGDTAFVVFRPRIGDPGTTTIVADSAAINRGGVSTTLVTVTVRNASGNSVGMSAGVVTLATTIGTLTAVTDHGDGTYTATLTAPLDAGIAVISGTLNGIAITSTATVQIRQQRTGGP